MNDRPHDRQRSARPPQGRSPASGATSRRWESWDDERDKRDVDHRDERWSPPAARPSHPRNGRSPSRPAARREHSPREDYREDYRGDDRDDGDEYPKYQRRSRSVRPDVEDEWRRDDDDAWSPARDRVAYPAARNGARSSGARSSGARNGARSGGRRADAARTRRNGARGWADAVEHWGETSRQWAISAANRLFTSDLPVIGRRGPLPAGRKDSTLDPAKKTQRIVLLVAIAFLLLCPVLGLLQLGVAYLQIRDGMAHLKNAQTDLGTLASHPFDPNGLAQIRAEFASANSDFSSANGGLQRVGVLGIVPIAGSKLAGAQRLMPIAVEATQAGMMGMDALGIIAPKMKNPFDASGTGITEDDLKAVSQRFDQIVPIVNQIIAQVQQLQPSDLTLDPRLGPLVGTMEQKLPQIKQMLTDVQGSLAVADTLLGVGAPANYLLEVMDSTELRPGGGFIGNYGFVTLSGGHMSGIKMQDVDLLDKSVKYGTKDIALPKGYEWFNGVFNGRWGFRDSNLDGDFPTSAKYGEHLYQVEDGTVSPVGVIAITPWLIKDALAITGPITLPEYNNLKVTPDNLVDEIHYYQLTDGVPIGPDTQYNALCQSSARKCFTGFLFKHFMDQVKADSSKDMGPLLKVIMNGLHSKDIQIYLNAAPAEDLLNQLHMADTIEAPATGDSFFDVDANIIANKSNYVVTDALSDQVTIDNQGNTTHNSVMTYTWPKDPKTLSETYPSTSSRPDNLVQYQRVYLPTTAKIGPQVASGWYEIAKITTAFNRQVYGGRMSVTYGTKTNLGLVWSNPGAVVHDGNGWHYTYLMQKQGGITYTLSVKIVLPSCAQLSAVPSGFKQTDAHTLTLDPEPFTADTNISLDYTGC